MRKLRLVSGIIGELEIARGHEDPVFTQDEKSLAGGAAIAAAVAGEFFSSAALANSSKGAEIDMEYFTCTVNSQRLSGRFHRVEFANGEEIEFVIEENTSRTAVVHGARNPGSRLVWTLPYHTRGHRAQRAFNFKWIMLASLACSIGPTLFFVYRRPHAYLPGWMIPSLLLGFFFITAFIGVLIAARFYRFSLEATVILEAFGYPNPASISLPAVHKAAEKRWRAKMQETPDLFHPWRFRY